MTLEVPLAADPANSTSDVVRVLSARLDADASVVAHLNSGVKLVSWHYSRAGVDYSSVASVGLGARLGRPFEVVCDVLSSQSGAAVVAARLVVERFVSLGEQVWPVGQVAVNASPLLAGTLMRALVVTPVAEDEALGLHHVTLLTGNEADAVAALGADYFAELRTSQASVFADVERREDAVAQSTAA